MKHHKDTVAAVERLRKSAERLISCKHPTLAKSVMRSDMWAKCTKGIWWASQLMDGRIITRYGRSMEVPARDYHLILLWMKAEAEQYGWPDTWRQPGFKAKLEKALDRWEAGRG